MAKFKKAIVAFKVSMSIKIVGHPSFTCMPVKMSQVIQEINMLSQFVGLFNSSTIHFLTQGTNWIRKRYLTRILPAWFEIS